jgi:hypothetical protein
LGGDLNFGGRFEYFRYIKCNINPPWWEILFLAGYLNILGDLNFGGEILILVEDLNIFYTPRVIP